ncbi:MAG: hypothetical protein SOW78_05565 [Clostridia bacterium]|nr:hypothetical protein [Clostridia bacterium]
MKGIKMYTRIQKKIPQNTECQHLTVFMALTVNFNTTEKAVHFSKRLVHSELFFFSSQDRRTVNNRT